MSRLKSLIARFSEVRTPFKGPRTASNARPPFVLSITNAQLDPRTRAVFDRYTSLLARQLPDAPGLVKFSIRKQLLGPEVWTLSLWTNDQAASAFVASPLHVEAIRKAMPSVIRARFHRLPWPHVQRPSWSQVKAIIAQQPWSTTYSRPETASATSAQPRR